MVKSAQVSSVALLLSESTGHKQIHIGNFKIEMRQIMQNLETGKQNINELLSKYRPLGPRHLLAAALMQRPREDEKPVQKTPIEEVA